MRVSFVIPCYRSERTLGNVVMEIQETMAGLNGYDYEIILVNDCSPDDTWGVIRRLCEGDSRIRGVNFSRNFGHEAAMIAGIDHAQEFRSACGTDGRAEAVRGGLCGMSGR